jgi:hypothetical protein
MALEFQNRRRPTQSIAAWRRERLLDAGFERELARDSVTHLRTNARQPTGTRKTT